MISVIVPVYNSEKRLKKCVESIICQNETDIEIILVDDGSIDSSGEICDYYKKRDERIRVIHKVNGGVSEARNAGLDVAKGEYVMFCDSDDYVSPNWCSAMIDAIKHNYRLIISEVLEDENGSQKKLLDGLNKEYCVREIVERIESIPTISYIWNKIFDRRIIELNHISFDASCSLGESKLFILDYLRGLDPEDKVLLGSVEPLYYYVLDNGEHLSKKIPSNYWQYFDKRIEKYRLLIQDMYIPSEAYVRFCNQSIEYYVGMMLQRKIELNTISLFDKYKYFRSFFRTDKLMQKYNYTLMEDKEMSFFTKRIYNRQGRILFLYYNMLNICRKI